MIDLKDYDIINGVAYPKKKKGEKPVVKAKVIDANDYKDTEVEVKKDDKED